MRKFALSFSLFLISQMSFGQDIHLSQFYTNQQNLNPATTGMYEGRYRVVANHRNQWRQIGGNPITTSMIGFDQKFHFFSDEIAAGLIVVRDEFSGFSQVTGKYILSGSYKKTIDFHEFRAGLQFGLTTRSTDLSSQLFPNQWVRQRGIFDQSVDNQESSLEESQNFFDINIGFAWSKTFSKFKSTAGIAFFHVNRPKDTYFDDAVERLRMRPVVHGELEIDIKSDLKVKPRILYSWTTKSQNSMIGGNVYKAIQHPLLQTIYGGLMYRDGFGRNGDAIIPVAGLIYKTVDIGLSYDVNVSELSGSNQKGTFELSLTYTPPAFNPKSLSIPCHRY